MKFGNYNLTSADDRDDRAFVSSLRKVRSTSCYIVGKFNQKVHTLGHRKSISSRSDSPLSYQASMFDEQQQQQHQRAPPQFLDFLPPKYVELREKLMKMRSEIDIDSSNQQQQHYVSCQKFVESDFHRSEESDEVKFSHINNAITGNRAHKMQSDVYFTIKRPTTAVAAQQDDSVRKSYKFSPPPIIAAADEEPKIRTDLSTLLKSKPYDEKVELEILRNYFDSMTYSEICNDKDFKNYLKRKNYQDAIDYIYSGRSMMGSSLRCDKSTDATQVLKRYYDLDIVSTTQKQQQQDINECDSIKHQKKLNDAREYFNKENSQFFCKSNKNFDDYYQKNTNIFYEATKTVDNDFFQKDLRDFYKTYDRLTRLFNEDALQRDEESLIDELYDNKCQQTGANFNYSTLQPTSKTQRAPRQPKPVQNHYELCDMNSEQSKFRTYPQKRNLSYKKMMKQCDATLNSYKASVDMDARRMQELTRKGYTEKAYNKIIKLFVRMRGFETAEAYVHYHYGRILDKSFDEDLKLKIREALKRRQEQLVISKPILKMTTQLSVIANSSLPPPYTSGSFERMPHSYFYRRHDNNIDTNRQGSRLTNDNKMYNKKKHQILFKFFEDMNINNIDFDDLISRDELLNKSCDNLHDGNYVSADNIYESIRVVCNHPNPHHHHRRHQCHRKSSQKLASNHHAERLKPHKVMQGEKKSNYLISIFRNDSMMKRKEKRGNCTAFISTSCQEL